MYHIKKVPPASHLKIFFIGRCMIKSIFELENRLDINKEFEKIIYELYEDEQAALYAEEGKKYRYE